MGCIVNESLPSGPAPLMVCSNSGDDRTHASPSIPYFTEASETPISVLFFRADGTCFVFLYIGRVM